MDFRGLQVVQTIVNQKDLEALYETSTEVGGFNRNSGKSRKCQNLGVMVANYWNYCIC